MFQHKYKLLSIELHPIIHSFKCTSAHEPRQQARMHKHTASDSPPIHAHLICVLFSG